jgi:hypothetical protein
MAALDPNVLIAALATSVPATIASVAAWRSSRSTNKKIETNHGKSPGQYLEDTHAEVVSLREEARAHNRRDERAFTYLKVPEEVLQSAVVEGDSSA